jgi:hypothetical protein
MKEGRNSLSPCSVRDRHELGVSEAHHNSVALPLLGRERSSAGTMPRASVSLLSRCHPILYLEIMKASSFKP